MKQGPISGAPAVQMNGDSLTVLPRPAKTNHYRRWRVCRDAARQLHELGGIELPPLVLGEPLDWSEIDMDKGVPERNARGAELAAAGFMP